MSKKTAIITFSVALVLLIGGFLAWYFYRGQGQVSVPPPGTFPETDTTGPSGPPADEKGQLFNNGGKEAPALKELSVRPSAGAVVLFASSTNTVTVRFVERGTGNVYEVSPQTDGGTRLSNTTIPKIEEALWSKDGGRTVVRYAGDGGDIIKTYSALLAKAGDQSEGALQGTFLTENIRSITENPEQNKIFYLLKHSGGSTGIISGLDGSSKNQVFDSPLKDWLLQWPSSSIIALTTKPSSGVPGFMFFLDTKTGTLTKAISGINGLTTLVSPNGSSVLYSENTAQGLSLKIYSFKDGVGQDVSVTTLPEKCVWSKNDSEVIYCAVPSYLPNGNYPDDWYKGLVSFSDEIWKINASTGAGELVTKLKDYAKKDIDGINLFSDPKGDYLFFTDKNDSHLWSLRLN